MATAVGPLIEVPELIWLAYVALWISPTFFRAGLAMSRSWRLTGAL